MHIVFLRSQNGAYYFWSWTACLYVDALRKNTPLPRLQNCKSVFRSWGYTSHPTHLKTRRGRFIYKSFKKFTSIFPGWVELVQSCWKLRHSIWMVMLFAILRRFSMVMWIPQKVAMAIHWEFCEVSCEFHFFPHRKLWGSQSIYINLLSSVFGRYHLSLFQRLLSKISSIWDCMILSDIREALDWTLNWNWGFWGDNVPIQQNGNQFCSTQPINRDRWGPSMVFGNTTKGWDPYYHKHTWDLLPRTTGRKFSMERI